MRDIIGFTEYETPKTYRDMNLECSEGELAYTLLLKHSREGQLVESDDNVLMKELSIRSTVSDLECALFLPCEPGAAPGFILRRREVGLFIVHYLASEVIDQSLLEGETSSADPLMRLYASRKRPRTTASLEVLLSDLSELTAYSIETA